MNHQFQEHLLEFTTDFISKNYEDILRHFESLPNRGAFVIYNGLKNEDKNLAIAWLQKLARNAYLTLSQVQSTKSEDELAADEFDKALRFSLFEYDSKHRSKQESKFPIKTIYPKITTGISRLGTIAQTKTFIKFRFIVSDEVAIFTNIEIKPRAKTLSFNHTLDFNKNLIAYDHDCVNIFSALGFNTNEINIQDLNSYEKCHDIINYSFDFYKNFIKSYLRMLGGE